MRRQSWHQRVAVSAPAFPLLVLSPLCRAGWQWPLSYPGLKGELSSRRQTGARPPVVALLLPSGSALAGLPDSGARSARDTSRTQPHNHVVGTFTCRGRGGGKSFPICCACLGQHAESFKIDRRDGVCASLCGRAGEIRLQLQGGNVGKSHVRKGLVLLTEVQKAFNKLSYWLYLRRNTALQTALISCTIPLVRCINYSSDLQCIWLHTGVRSEFCSRVCINFCGNQARRRVCACRRTHGLRGTVSR